jgi:hypothetical protein
LTRLGAHLGTEERIQRADTILFGVRASGGGRAIQAPAVKLAFITLFMAAASLALTFGWAILWIWTDSAPAATAGFKLIFYA